VGRHRGAGIIPSVRLTQIFRQTQQIGVVTNAHRINAGQMPIARGPADFFLFAEDDAERAADLTVDIVANRLPGWFGLDPRCDVQVLCQDDKQLDLSRLIVIRLQERSLFTNLLANRQGRQSWDGNTRQIVIGLMPFYANALQM
jgi:hypothetical protein